MRRRLKKCDIRYKYISSKLDGCVKRMQREMQKKEKNYKVSYILASDELARRLLK